MGVPPVSVMILDPFPGECLCGQTGDENVRGLVAHPSLSHFPGSSSPQ